MIWKKAFIVIVFVHGAYKNLTMEQLYPTAIQKVNT